MVKVEAQDIANVTKIITDFKISKKLTITSVTLIVILANKFFDLKLDDMMIQTLVQLVMVYVVGQSAVDAVKSIKG